MPTFEETAMNRLFWMKRNLKIIPKADRMCNLDPNIGQLMLWKTINIQRKANLPVRIILLKPRQVGWSTWSCAESFTEAYFKPFFNTGLFSLDTDSTDHIFRMIRLFADELPAKMKRPMENTNRKEIVFAKPHRSRMISQTAGKEGAGHSYTFRYVHCSEVSRWDNAANTLAGIFQSISNVEGTYAILESTANGMGGVFYEMYWEAVKRLKEDPKSIRGFLPVFFPWYKFPEYSTPIYEGFRVQEDEKEDMEKYSLSEGQVLWRRDKLGELKGDVELFRESYPGTAIEAFQASGNPAFSRAQLDYQKKNISSNPRYVLFKKEGGDVIMEDVNTKINCWQILRYKRDVEYVMGIDTREDKLSDSSDPKSKLDFDGAAVLNRSTRDFVAIWMGKTEHIDFAKQAFWCALYYNEPWVVIEMPKGITVLRYFVNKQYENLYSRQKHEDRGDPEDTDIYGFRTDTATRRWLVDDFRAACHEKNIRVCFQDIYDQMETFIKDKTGKPIHMPGMHDDLLFAAFLALQGDIRCPRSSNVIAYEEGERPARSLRNLSFSGAVDTDDDEEDEDETWNYTS